LQWRKLELFERKPSVGKKVAIVGAGLWFKLVMFYQEKGLM
jgi:hypothetical protein